MDVVAIVWLFIAVLILIPFVYMLGVTVGRCITVRDFTTRNIIDELAKRGYKHGFSVYVFTKDDEEAFEELIDKMDD